MSIPLGGQVKTEGPGIQCHLLTQSESQDCWAHWRAETMKAKGIAVAMCSDCMCYLLMSSSATMLVSAEKSMKAWEQ